MHVHTMYSQMHNLLYLASHHSSSEHDNGVEFVLPNHPPEVSDGVGHGALGCDVGILMGVALSKHRGRGKGNGLKGKGKTVGKHISHCILRDL